MPRARPLSMLESAVSYVLGVKDLSRLQSNEYIVTPKPKTSNTSQFLMGAGFFIDKQIDYDSIVRYLFLIKVSQLNQKENLLKALNVLTFVLSILLLPLNSWAEEDSGKCKKLNPIVGGINAETFYTVANINTACVSNGHKTHLTLSSLGGETSYGIASFEILRATDGWKNLTTFAYGHVASSATLIFMAGKNRLISCNSKLTVHETTVSGLGSMRAKELTNAVADVASNNATFASIYAQATKIPHAVVLNIMAESTNMTASEAVKYGFATGTIPEKCL
jgi:ATP-dependent protease ClpP protease subunit